MAEINLLNSFSTVVQIPLDSKLYRKTLSEISTLGENDVNAYKYYEDAVIHCVENHTDYIWREELYDGEGEGLLTESFIYPDGIITNGIDYSNRTFNMFKKVSPLESFVVKGTSIGKYEDGDIVPAHTSSDERWKDIGTKQILPTFTLPVANITTSINPNNSTEVGTVLTNVLFTVSLTQNDGGVANLYKILKDNIEILNDTITNTKTETFELSTTPIIFKANISYDAGTIPKDDNLEPPNSIPNNIIAGNDDSIFLSYRGYRAIFYGNFTSKNITSNDIRTNLIKRLENSGNTFILNTGNIDTIFQVWLPTGITLSSIIDLDALNANITSSYVSESLTVNDAGGNPIAGNLYTMEQSVPYSSNHRHQITIS